MTISIAEPRLGVGEYDRLLEVAASGQLGDGRLVRRFESAFADYCGVSHGVATANGTTALHAALHALGIGPGDAVVTTPFSFVASANAIRLCGARPVFADVNPRTLNLEATAVQAALEEHDDIAAILAVHLYGLPAAVGPLRELADEHDVALVEDAAQAHGATVNGRRIGSFGDVACFSFYPTKNLTTGEGGMIVTDDESLAETAARFVNHGRTGRYAHADVGHNFRLTSLGAGLGLAQLERLADLLDVRRRTAARYDEALADQSAIEAPPNPPGMTHAYHQYTVRSDYRDELQDHLSEAGIDTAVYYPTPIHRLAAYTDVEATAPIAERAARTVLSVPVHPSLSSREIDRVASALEEFVP